MTYTFETDSVTILKEGLTLDILKDNILSICNERYNSKEYSSSYMAQFFDNKWADISKDIDISNYTNLTNIIESLLTGDICFTDKFSKDYHFHRDSNVKAIETTDAIVVVKSCIAFS